MGEGVTFLFTIDDNLRAMFAPGQVKLVYDDGVYLCDMSGTAPVRVIRPDNGNLGLDPGVGDDWVETIPPEAVTFRPGDRRLAITLSDDYMTIETQG